MRSIADRLTVPGANLYYEVRGTGPVLLVVPSESGDAAPFAPLADRLADRYTVITYDRRGFSRSTIDEPFEDEDRLAADADNARLLVDHVLAGGAVVFGTGSGAIVALATAERHRERFDRIVVHEPPLFSVLPEAQEWEDVQESLYRVYQDSGVAKARRMSGEWLGMDRAGKPPRDTEPDRIRRNQAFWFEHELLTYPAYKPDLHRLKLVSDRVVLACGETARDCLPYRPNTVLAAQLGQELVRLPGGHLGYVTHPAEFADALRRALRSAE